MGRTGAGARADNTIALHWFWPRARAREIAAVEASPDNSRPADDIIDVLRHETGALGSSSCRDALGICLEPICPLRRALVKEGNSLGEADRKDRADHRIDRWRWPIGRPPARRSRSARPGAWTRCGERRPESSPTSKAQEALATFFRADLASLAEVRRLADAVQEATDRLDILINNAGIGTAGGVRQESADGFELRFAVNYLAGFLLTLLLLPLFGPGRRHASSMCRRLASRRSISLT